MTAANITLLIVSLICISVISPNIQVDAKALTPKEQCVQSIKSIDSIAGYLDFAAEWTPDMDTSADKREVDVINKCLHSVNGLEDVRTLQGIVQQASTTHSVCEPEFVEQLLQFDRQLKENVTRGKYLKRKQKNRLARFFRLFAGQVVLTCKKSLISKLQFAEEKDEKLAEAFERINRLSAKADGPQNDGISNKLSPGLRKLVSLTMKYKPSVFKRVENLILSESLKPTPDAVLSIGVTLNTEKMLNEFLKTKQACKLIDEYAQSSIYTIARLAWKGYLARNDGDSLDESLTNDERVQKWIKAVQYCQGVLIVEAKLDLDQESLLKLNQESLNDEQIIIVDLQRAQQVGQNQIVDRAVFRYEQPDIVSQFDENLKCYTYSSGMIGWLLKRVTKGERLMAKYVKVSGFDELFKRSMLDNQGDDLDDEVKFGGMSGATGGSGFSHVTNHVVINHHHGAHAVHHLGGSAGAEIGIVLAISIGIVFFVFLLSLLGSYLCYKY